MQEANVRKLKRGDVLRVQTKGTDARAAMILCNFVGVRPTVEDDLIFVRWDTDGCLFVSFKGVISNQAWLPKRFLLAVSQPMISKEEQLLQKIDTLWKRQEYYREHHVEA